MILLDTHVWIWYLSNPTYLSEKAFQVIEEARRKEGIFISCISTWEFFMLVQKKRLVLSVDEVTWIRQVERLTFFRFIPIDNDIARLSVQLPDLHPDPADRIILATARILGSTLVTKDERLLNYPHVATLW